MSLCSDMNEENNYNLEISRGTFLLSKGVSGVAYFKSFRKAGCLSEPKR
jgi:hypothetical protein